MKVTLLGHASVYVEMRATRCLMDPVFIDPFEDGAVVSCPRREIAVDEIPRVDLLVISHAHLDHFDIPSLARVARRSRGCDVLCPEDRSIIYALERLGFEKIHPEKPLRRFAFDRFEVLTTHSSVKNVIEFGVVLKDHSGTFWNQVDTFVAPELVPQTLEGAGGKIDLLFAMYASQNFDFFESRATGFPHAMHQVNLRSVARIKPKMAVPGAAGFRFTGDMEWCNAFLFPMSRERFVADLARVAPDIETRIANPGDVFEIEGGHVYHKPGRSRLARMVEDDTDRLRFDPTAPIPPLVDPNPAGLGTDALVEGVASTLEAFVRFVRESVTDPVIAEYCACAASYSVVTMFPDGPERWLRIDWKEGSPEISAGEGRSPVSGSGHRIVASALAAWARYEKSYFYLRAFSRKWSSLYDLAPEGEPTVIAKEPQDLLAYYLERKAPGAEIAAKKWIDFQLKPFVGT